MNLTDEQKARLFDALEGDGVDNWEGFNYDGGHYERVLAEIEAEEKYEENRKRIEPLIEIIIEHADAEEPSERGAGFMVTLPEDGIKEIVKFISENYDAKK